MARLCIRLVRPGVGTQEWAQDLLVENPDFILSSFTFDLERPLIVDGKIVAASGFSGYLFEMLRENTEIIAVFDYRGKLTGYYVNLNSEPRRFPGGYEVTDWFLDLWVFPDLHHRVLDEDEFDAAVARGLLDPGDAERARSTLRRVLASVAARDFPPRAVREFFLREDRPAKPKPDGSRNHD